MIFTRADYKNMKMLKEKLGSWSDTYDYLDIKPRSARYMRRRFREDNIQEYKMIVDNAEMIEKRLDFLPCSIHILGIHRNAGLFPQRKQGA